ncbi:MAG: ABC transporter permease subunit [Legionellaceae bacterium]
MKKMLQQIYMAIVYILLYFPLIILILYSVNQAKFSLLWHGFSFHWYHELFLDADLWSAFFHSIFLGVTASAIATGMGLIACLHFFISGARDKSSFYTLLLLLIILPDLVLGIALLLFFNITGIPLGFFSLLIAHITFCLPFIIITISSRIHTLDTNLYHSALDLGASKRKAIMLILLPLLWPAILSAFLLSFTLSFDDVIISYFVAGPDFSILSLTIYSLVRSGVTPELNALCTITFMISMLLVIIAHRASRKSTS